MKCWRKMIAHTTWGESMKAMAGDIELEGTPEELAKYFEEYHARKDKRRKMEKEKEGWRNER